MSEEVERSAALIERLLGEPDLRRRFREDAATVLGEFGLLELADGLGRGRRAMMTLELRESRSSLAGVMVAAAAEGVDFAHLAERAVPGLERQAGQAVDRLLNPQHHHPQAPAPAKHAAPAAPKPSIGPSIQNPPTLAPEPAPRHTAAPSPLPQSSPGQTTAADPTSPAASPPASGDTGFAATPPGGGAVAASAGQETAQQAGQGSAHPEGTGGTPPAQQHAHDHAPTGADPAPAPDPSTGGAPYPGDSAPPQQIAAWMGAHAQAAGLPPELPVMAALTESGLRNLDYGDRDSVGFFQMRVGIWNQGAYTGYPSNPQLQIQWFIDHAVAARNADPALAQNPASWGEWVANVEQPAAEYRYRYQLQLGTAQALLRGAELAPAPDHAVHVAVGPSAVEVAKKLVGQPGGAGAGAGLLQRVYAQEGIQLPPAAAEQFDVGIPVGREHLRPGDAVFFAGADHAIAGAGLYIGDGRVISASHDHIRTLSLSDPSLHSTYAGARRYTAAAVSDPSRYARSLPTIGS